MNTWIVRIVVSFVACAVVGGIGCERKPVQPAKSSPQPAAAAPAKGNDKQGLAEFLKKDASQSGASASSAGMNGPSGALPPGHPPIGGMATSQPMAGGLPPGHPAIGATPPGMEPPGDVPPLKYDPPAEWKSQPVASAMRKAQFLLPRAGGDSEDGQLIVFQFGKGQGGAVDPNIQRWIGMFSTKDGRPVGQDAVKRESREVGGLKVTILDVSGRFTDAMMATGGSATPKDSYRLLGAIVETPDGPWFFKAVGPAATMQAHREAFVRMLDTVRR